MSHRPEAWFFFSGCSLERERRKVRDHADQNQPVIMLIRSHHSGVGGSDRGGGGGDMGGSGDGGSDMGSSGDGRSAGP